MTFTNLQWVSARLPRFSFYLLLAAGLVVVGCDLTGTDETEDVGSVTITGQVTDDQSSSGTSSASSSVEVRPKAGVEGATVTAVSVGPDGSVDSLEGEATTGANGEYTITVEGVEGTDVVRLDAEGEGDFSSSTIVAIDGQSEVGAQPMTAETNAEAEVYVDAKAKDESSSHDEGVMPADVAFYVDAATATDVNTGEASVGKLASALVPTVDAEMRTIEEVEEVDAAAVADAKANAFSQLQSGLSTAGDVESRGQAVVNFEETMSNLFVEAGASAETQAEARQTSTSLLIEASAGVSDEGAFGLRRQAELLRAEATARAQEAIFEAQDAGESVMDALVDARETLISDIRAATSVEDIVNAKQVYAATAKSQMETTFGVDAATIATAESEIEGAETELFTSLNDIGDLLENAADVTVNAYDTFYSEARSSAQSTFETEIDESSRAEAAAEALVFLIALDEN